MPKFKFEIKDPIQFINNVIGVENKNIKFIEEKTNTQIEIQPTYAIIDAANEHEAKNIFNGIKSLINISNTNPNVTIKKWDVDFLFSDEKFNSTSDNRYQIDKVEDNESFIKEHEAAIISNYKNPISSSNSGKAVFPKTSGQAKYFDLLKKNTLIFCTGPAGSGKTFIAIVYAIELLKQNIVKKIILSRPAIEAHESLGFLPGGLREKIDPYLIPLYDSLFYLLGKEKTENLIKSETIEIAPLAFMRGRTFDDAFIILDEAQNTDRNQMKMFLTRLGYNSKMVITGDLTQTDIEPYHNSGLIHAVEVLKNTKSITFCKLEASDIVRNPIVKDIVNAYDLWKNNAISKHEGSEFVDEAIKKHTQPEKKVTSKSKKVTVKKTKTIKKTIKTKKK